VKDKNVLTRNSSWYQWLST